MSRLFTPRRVGALLTSLALLCSGIWLGAHPRFLLDPVADLLVGDSSQRAVPEALEEIHDSYYREIDRERLADAAIDGAVASLKDRFSDYFTPAEYRAFQDQTRSRFNGVGIAVRGVRGGLRVETVYDDSPAERAGIRVRDVIVEADGRRLAGLPERAAINRIKGPRGTQVELKLRRGERTLTVRVTRATISVPVVAGEAVRAGGERASHIRLATFSSGAHGEVAAAVARARRHRTRGIVFDLRGNGGGLVNEAQLVASVFLDGGVVVTTRGRSVKERTLRAVGEPVAADLPVVVLVDGGTASAAEIVAGALQDRGRARVVGTRTFGKGVFQEVVPLENGGALDITVGQYFTPSGKNLGGSGVRTGVGIRPDVQVRDKPGTEADEALQKALDVLARRL